MKPYEFETRMPKYEYPFLVQYSIEAGKPVLEQVVYDELPIDISQLHHTVAAWVNDAITNNFSTVKKDEFDRQFVLLSKTNSLLGLAAKDVIAAGGASDEKAAEVIAQLKKQIKENRHDVSKMIGAELVQYFETAKL